MDEVLKEIKKNLNEDERVLLVTEYVSSGLTASKLLEKMRKNGIVADLAVLARAQAYFDSPREVFKDRGPWLKKIKDKILSLVSLHKEPNVYVGADWNDTVPLVDMKSRDLAGVERIGNGELISRSRYILDDVSYAGLWSEEEMLNKNRRNVNTAREDVKLLASKAIDRVWN